MATSEPGFMLLDEHFHPVAFNFAAIEILAFPTKADRIKQANVFLDKIRSSLLTRQGKQSPEFVREYRSGARRYICRTFRLDCNIAVKSAFAVALLLERHTSSADALSELTHQFDLTGRESETVSLLLEGLTRRRLRIECTSALTP